MQIKPYTPDFSTAFQHFCIHPGGKAVIAEVRCPASVLPVLQACAVLSIRAFSYKAALCLQAPGCATLSQGHQDKLAGSCELHASKYLNPVLAGRWASS